MHEGRGMYIRPWPAAGDWVPLGSEASLPLAGCLTTHL